MSARTSSLLQGDDYQHLWSWLFILELLMPFRKARCVIVEDVLAGSVDDVTIRREQDASSLNEFYQIKYHVDHRGEYSSDALLAHDANHTSLLMKFWQSWQLLRSQERGRYVAIHLLTNW